MENLVVKKSTKLGKKVWLMIIFFGLIGQIAWVVENVYFSTYIQKKITADAWATSLTVGVSAVVAALATIFGGAISDRVGKRKPFVCFGYIIWGVITACFAFFGNKSMTTNIVLIALIFVAMDAVMTLFGSLSNDAAFSAWISDITDITNRGFVDTVLSVLPVAALMIIFVVFDSFTQSDNWTTFFLILGGLTTLCGVLGLFLFKDSKSLKPNKSGKYMQDVVYGFRPKTVKQHKMIYICQLGMMFSGLSMQLWQPQMIMLIQYTIGLENYVIPLALVVLLSAGLALVFSKLMDKFGKEKFFIPVVIAGTVGGILVYLIKFFGATYTAKFLMFVIGGTLVESASLLSAGLFNASARDYTPKEKVGCFQGVRIIICVTLPMVLSSLINPQVINAFGELLTETSELVIKDVGYHAGDRVYPFEMFLFASIAAFLMIIPAIIVKCNDKAIRKLKLAEITSQQDNLNVEIKESGCDNESCNTDCNTDCNGETDCNTECEVKKVDD